MFQILQTVISLKNYIHDVLDSICVMVSVLINIQDILDSVDAVVSVLQAVYTGYSRFCRCGGICLTGCTCRIFQILQMRRYLSQRLYIQVILDSVFAVVSLLQAVHKGYSRFCRCGGMSYRLYIQDILDSVFAVVSVLQAVQTGYSSFCRCDSIYLKGCIYMESSRFCRHGICLKGCTYRMFQILQTLCYLS